MLLSRRITSPIGRLTVYARAVRDGKRVKLPDLGGGETRELGEAFDEMRTSLEGKQYVEKYIQTLTHEIKSPLSAIHGAVELLAEDIPPDQRSRFLSNIKDETERIKEVVEKLLLLSSLEKRNTIEDVKKLDMKELLGSIKESLFPVLQSKELTLKIMGDDDFSVEGDPFLVRQALYNLIQNAIEFSGQGGAIVASLSKNDDSVTLTVCDRGSGIPDYACERIFERFYSLKRPDTGKKSSGLGLCLVREVATLHQGRIELENVHEGGAIATLTLPQRFSRC
jgi:two-component system sensor histidine kinase CreC